MGPFKSILWDTFCLIRLSVFLREVNSFFFIASVSLS